MGTKTVDDAGNGTETETRTGEAEAATGKAQEAADSGAEAADRTGEAAGETAEEAAEGSAEAPVEEAAKDGPSGVGLGAAAVVSAVLGLVSLTGGWIGTVAAARATLIGQLKTSSNASVATQVQAVYGDAWQTTALWAGAFALAALIAGVVVLARPAFGAPGTPQAGWIKSVAWAGVSLGVLGLLLAVLKYSDALLGLPSTS
ncbi:hypothetical protein ACQEV4_10985 [Streptomyces shenzhenensis]|uniref:hypothetical protein n=1 Tax=Streptomyces shenzhenensis TaxID=943815 RepID=UPI003D92536C